ncbi:MAG: LuxR family transcriptional regulator [Pseudomonadota bacterium]
MTSPPNLMEYTTRILDATSIEHVWTHHLSSMASFGFNRLLYGMTHNRSATGFGNTDDILILSNHSQDYIDRLLNGGLFHSAPMLRCAANTIGAFSWRDADAFADPCDTKARAVATFNEAHGVVAGYTISFRSDSVRDKAAIALTARIGLSQDEVDAIWAEHGPLIEAMNGIAHLRISALPQDLPARSLSRRQREALEWVGDGKTMQDIAQIMGLKTATVEKHLRRAREQLGVETTAQAVLKASVQNQIFVVEQDAARD